MKEQQTSPHGKHQTCSGGPQTQTQHVTALEHLGHGIVCFPSQYDIEVALKCPLWRNRRDRKDFLLREVAWIVTKNKPGTATTQKPVHRVEGDLVSLDPAGRCRIGQNHTLRIEQIDFNTGVNDHQQVKNVLQGLTVDVSVSQWQIVRHQMLREGPVELLSDLLIIQPGGHQRQADVQATNQAEQPQQDGGELAIERGAHAASGGLRCTAVQNL